MENMTEEQKKRWMEEDNSLGAIAKRLERERLEAWNRYVAEGKVEYDGVWIDLEAKTVNVPTIEGYEAYEFELDDLRTPREFTDWIQQLEGKSWMTAAKLGALIKAVSEYAHVMEDKALYEFFGLDKH